MKGNARRGPQGDLTTSWSIDPCGMKVDFFNDGGDLDDSGGNGYDDEEEWWLW